MEMYEVGGCVRDEILGVKSKDIDFTVVLPQGSYRDPFEFMCEELESQGFKIFLKTPEFLTARAQFPRTGPMGYNKLTADFVLARKESGYSDGRRPDHVRPGTLDDDLARRDFTMNAIAKTGDGSYVDPFNGRGDIAARIIRAVGDPSERLREDALRAVRALRFSVTKGFKIDPELRWAMQTVAVLDGVAVTSPERIREEINKMFIADTMRCFALFDEYPALFAAMFASGKIHMEASMRTRGR